MLRFQSLLTAPLAISDDGKDILLPILAKVLRGESFDAEAVQEGKPQGYYGYIGENLVQASYTDNLPNKQGLAYYDIHGVINNEDYYYTMSSTRALQRAMLTAENDPSVVAHFLNFNSPGGDATSMLPTGDFIHSQVKKPTIAFISGACQSAAYCFAASCDVVIANFRTDRVGSVGILTTLKDMSAYYAAQGIKLIEIISDLSPDKGIETKQALSGDIQPYKDAFINPLAQAFIDHIEKVRPTTIGQNVTTGKTYLAQDGVANGLVDEIMSYENAVSKAFDLARQYANPKPIISNQNFLSNMKLFGIDLSGAQKTDKGVVISTEVFAQLEAKATEEAAAAAKEAVKAENQPLLEAINKLTETVKAQGETITQLKAFQDETPATPPAQAQGGNPQGEDPQPVKPWEDFNKTYAMEYINGTHK